jgi:hypothetical protein
MNCARLIQEKHQTERPVSKKVSPRGAQCPVLVVMMIFLSSLNICCFDLLHQFCPSFYSKQNL